MEKVKRRAEQYEVSVRDKETKKGKIYYECRITFKIGGDKSPRLQKGGKTKELAVLNLLTALADYIKTSFQNGLINTKIDDIVKQRLVSSINDLCLNMPEITQKILEIINIIDSVNAQILNKVYLPSNVLSFNQQISSTSNDKNELYLVQHNGNPIIEKNVNKELYNAEQLFKEWLKYRFSLCVETDDNPKPKCRKTIQENERNIRDTILPYIKKYKKIYIQELTEEFIRGLIKNTNGQNKKRKVHLTLDMIFQYAIKNKIVTDNPLKYIDRPPQPKKDEQKKKDDYLKTDEIDYWLDIFEQANTDMSILFETMLLAGLRPEEACGLKWTSLLIEDGFLLINNAYKDFIEYDEDFNPIGHTRGDDKLKTGKSYREVPLDPRLAEILLKHKKKQQELFKTSRAIKKKGRKWSEDEYMFLSRTYQPYVSDTLSRAMPKFRKKYNLTKHITPYGLRYSYASYWAQMGLDKVSLMRAMRSRTIFNNRADIILELHQNILKRKWKN